ncbi:MAG: cation diffusion facilitator family transporter [Caulobacteraceae bacterium]
MNATDSIVAGHAAATRRVTILSVAVASVLVAFKAVVWLSSGSVALMASMADSALDLVASTATFFAVRYAAAPPDAEHRYGHGKAEAFAGLIQAGLVFGSAALIGEEAVRHILAPHPIQRQGCAIGAMVASTILTAGLVLAQTRLLRRVGSVAVSADRAHYAADLLSNLVALAGIAGAALLGFDRLDAAAGLIVGAILLWGAVVVFRQASDQLLDHELPDEARSRIMRLMSADPRLTNVHQLRTRAAGSVIHIQAHADLAPDLTLLATHDLLTAAEDRVRAAFPGADILIHADPRGAGEVHAEIPERSATGRRNAP